VSPYDTPFSQLGLEDFRAMLLRQADPATLGVRPDGAMLLIGAVDVLTGEFRTFNGRREAITADAVLASAAIPTVFRAVHLDGGTYGDGLFSQNPPVRELADTAPDEIWVIQINAPERETEPTTVVEIADRRNELAGNLSLHQELHFIEKIDQLLEEGVIAPGGRYKPIMVRVIELSRSRLSAWLGPASKLNRDPAFIRELTDHGAERADEFLAALSFERAWRAGDAEAVLALRRGRGDLGAGCGRRRRDVRPQPPRGRRDRRRDPRAGRERRRHLDGAGRQRAVARPCGAARRAHHPLRRG
jgi:NTE family protein